jgi:hypothetical protein
VSIFTTAGTSRGSSKDDRRRHMIYRRVATVAMIAGVLRLLQCLPCGPKGRASPEGLPHRAPACKGPFANRREPCCRHRSAGQRAEQSGSSARWPNPDIANHSNDRRARHVEPSKTRGHAAVSAGRCTSCRCNILGHHGRFLRGVVLCDSSGSLQVGPPPNRW